MPSLSGILGTFKFFAFVPISFSLAYIVRGKCDEFFYY